MNEGRLEVTTSKAIVGLSFCGKAGDVLHLNLKSFVSYIAPLRRRFDFEFSALDVGPDSQRFLREPQSVRNDSGEIADLQY
jgi:hypothetical protein